MAWSSSARRGRLPVDWGTIRNGVLVRDGFRCQWRLGLTVCGKPATDVDHIVRGDDHSMGNLRALCREHHARKSSFEGAEAYWSKVRESRGKFRNRGGGHPGVLCGVVVWLSLYVLMCLWISVLLVWTG